MDDKAFKQKRQIIYWRLLATVFGHNEITSNLEIMTAEITRELDLPEIILDPRISIDNLLHRYPDLEESFRKKCVPGTVETSTDAGETSDNEALKNILIYSKILLNIFGPNTRTPSISAEQYNQWLKDVSYLEQVFGYEPGGLRGSGRSGPGGGFQIDEEQLRTTLAGMDKDLIDRMELREVLNDDTLVRKLVPSIGIVEQLLRDKANLSGKALENAKAIIRQYINEVAELLKKQVVEAKAGKIDYSVPPKKIFSNLDLKKTIWKNLINWDSNKKKLYVNQLIYKHTAKIKHPKRMIVLVDQSGSMVDAMVQCTIIASIFSGLPKVDVHLLAFDTRVLDLTPWIYDPFEVLLRTRLGGGTSIHYALQVASERIEEPENTVLVLITDFYEGGENQALFDYIKSLKEQRVLFIPVGAVTSSGYFSVNRWFRKKLDSIGCPVLTGNPKILITQLKKFIG